MKYFSEAFVRQLLPNFNSNLFRADGKNVLEIKEEERAPEKETTLDEYMNEFFDKVM